MAILGKISALWKARWLFAHPTKMVQVFRDKRTPLMARILPVIALVYVFFPFDIAPDFLPFIGQIDDIGIAVYLITLALGMVPDEVFKSVGMEVPR